MVYQTEENSVPGIHRIVLIMYMTFAKWSPSCPQDISEGASLLFQLGGGEKTCTVPETLRCFGDVSNVQRKYRVS
jgi:hypothetical protein